MEQSNRGWSNGEWNSHVVVLIVVSYERSAFKINAFLISTVNFTGGGGFSYSYLCNHPSNLVD